MNLCRTQWNKFCLIIKKGICVIAMNVNKTLEYYNQNAGDFAKATTDVDFYETQKHFQNLLPEQGYILDFGCGAGRDTKYFLNQKFNVDAIDGSEALCRIASDYTGLKVRKMLFAELTENEKYDGIWACSSILHLSKQELKDVFVKMVLALKTDGIIYTSFKYGDYEGERNGRYFTDFTAETFKRFLQNIENVELKEMWVTGDVRPGRGDEKWLNLILQKCKKTCVG